MTDYVVPRVSRNLSGRNFAPSTDSRVLVGEEFPVFAWIGM